MRPSTRWPHGASAWGRPWPGWPSSRCSGTCGGPSEAATCPRHDRDAWLPSTAMAQRAVPAVLSIAGSDSGGGAGIQADLKAFARCGVHGMTAITALTAQSTTGVTGIHPVPPEFIIEQVAAVAADIDIAAVKIGMLGTAITVRAVREAIEDLDVPIVI